nr:D-alanine--D-alanine ligase [uncultured bacterium]
MSEFKKTRVGVIFGGRSGEHEVSLRSAESVIRSLDPSKYEVVPIAITHEGRWLGTRDAMKLLSPGEAIQAALKTGEPMAVVPEPQRNGAVDVFFPIVHGTYGEDGTIQGLLELAGVPYVGAGVLGSAVGMDKDVMKRLLREAGLPVGDFWVTRAKDIDAFIREFGKQLPYPVFVKPANLGSSVGITKVHNAGELPAAIAFAAEFDRKIIIEKGIDAREIEISVLGNDELKASIPGEIIPSREFYDYQAKYVDDDSRLIIPAPLSEQQVRQAQDLAIRSFQALDCSGMARVDLFLEKPTGKFLVNEINTLPGFTSISMYPKLWEATGLAYPDLVDRLITLAVERHAEKKKLRTKV